jgi:hypothetical protein
VVADRQGIERHRLDTFALTAGLLCLVVAGLVLVGRAHLLAVDGLVVLAAVWLVVGVVGITRVVHHLLHVAPGAEADVTDQRSSG